jgi:uncharacterized protein
MEWLGYAASIAIGIILGSLGGGGSILTIPILVYLFQLDVVTASAYSLFIVGMTSLVGTIPKYTEHLINIKTGVIFGIPSIISIFSTRKWIVPAIPESLGYLGSFELTKRLLLLGLFAILMIVVSYSIISKKEIRAEESHKFRTLILIMEGILIGFLTGLVGAGGGFLITPALVLLMGLPFKTAVGTSLFIIAVNSLAGFTGDLINRDIDWIVLLCITVLAIIGIFIGHYFSRLVSPVRLRQSFGWFVLITGCCMLAKELFYAWE